MIVKNEELNLRACLESVKGYADEIIVLDDASSDATVKIAEEFGAKIYQRKFDSFTLQKGYALSLCSCDWVLNVDADERLTDALKAEITDAVNNGKYNGYFLPSANTFLGKRMRYSGLQEDLKFRLCMRETSRYEGGLVHEELKVDGPVSKLKNPLTHIPYRDLDQYLQKFNFYTTLAARTLYSKGKRFNPLQMLRPPFDFFKIYFIRLGFLDGFQGFLWAFYSALYPFTKYIKLWYLNKYTEKK